MEPVVPRPAAAVILVRSRAGSAEFEVYLQRRHRAASFMANASVFPGGVAEAGEVDLRTTAVREVAEETGVALIPEQLHYYGQWVTPSFESRRFRATFYLGELPVGETPSIDGKEAVDQIWVTPREALASTSDLWLPPPQLRTLYELSKLEGGLPELFKLARLRAAARHPILPRCWNGAPARSVLLLPWDPAYLSEGIGESIPMPVGHPLAFGPSRAKHDGRRWILVSCEK
jgi:8-oxo-dGTP pyrophosphatase MutT (NUDIX family)